MFKVLNNLNMSAEGSKDFLFNFLNYFLNFLLSFWYLFFIVNV